MATDIIWLESVDSTNSEAKRRLAELGNISIIATKSQKAGRGQKTNKWFSESSRSLTFSMVLKGLNLKAWEQSTISEVTAQAVVDTLSSYGIDSRIKWPNDIYCGDKKICGILIENSLMGEHINWSIIGIGLNVNNTTFPDNLPNPTSMALISGFEHQMEEVLEKLIARLTSGLSDFRFDNR